MTEEKKYLAVILEAEFGEEGVESIYPVSVETAGHISKDQLEGIHHFLKYDDDASFDIHWELKALVRAKIEEVDT